MDGSIRHTENRAAFVPGNNALTNEQKKRRRKHSDLRAMIDICHVITSSVMHCFTCRCIKRLLPVVSLAPCGDDQGATGLQHPRHLFHIPESITEHNSKHGEKNKTLAERNKTRCSCDITQAISYTGAA